MSLKISSYCKINNDSISLNGKIMFKNEDKDESLTRSIYKFMDLSYPKFYKMDILSKYGFLASEMLISNQETLKTYEDDAVVLIFANSNSSTLTDLKYQETIASEKPSPSPSLFVYTLPNILLGEIAIRNKWYGENMFFVLPNFDAKFLVNYAAAILKKSDTKACLIAWVDVKEKKNDVFLCSIEKNEQNISNTLEFNEKNLTQIYLA